MIRELAHLARHAPGTLRLQRQLGQGALYDRLCARQDDRGLAVWRARLVADLQGDVVEIGAGTGLMFPHYSAGARVTAIEPYADFSDLARPRVAASAAAITVTRGTARSLPFSTGSVDAAVFGLVLCTVPDPLGALREAHRVLRPGGALRLLEHVRSPRLVAGALMRLANPLWRLANRQQCNLDRDPLPHLADAGFHLDRVEAFQVFSPGLPAFPLRAIWAHR